MRRHKRQMDANGNIEIFKTNMPSAMHFLLRLSHAIENVESALFTEHSEIHSRKRREAVDNISGVIQVLFLCAQ